MFKVLSSAIHILQYDELVKIVYYLKYKLIVISNVWLSLSAMLLSSIKSYGNLGASIILSELLCHGQDLWHCVKFASK